jgi:uncharacterized protein (DUF302 family)
MEKHRYGYTVKTTLSYAAALDAVVEALRREGFGVLTEIDVQATMKQKLGVDQAPYKILGACNPPLAHQALGAEPEIGLLLPCNVVVYSDASGDTIVSAIDPEALFTLVQRDDVAPIAAEVSARFRRVLEALPVLAPTVG